MTAEPPRRDPPFTPGEPLAIDGDRSVLAEQRRRGGRAADHQRVFPAERIDPAGHQPVEAVADFRVDGAPLLWFRPDLSAAVVDAERASDLVVVDATGLGAGAEVRVGRLHAGTRAALGPRELVRFLLLTGVVQTYAHIGATLRLDAERGDELEDGAYEADLSGSHVFFTNERNELPLAFTVRIAGDGVVTARGR